MIGTCVRSEHLCVGGPLAYPTHHSASECQGLGDTLWIVELDIPHPLALPFDVCNQSHVTHAPDCLEQVKHIVIRGLDTQLRDEDGTQFTIIVVIELGPLGLCEQCLTLGLDLQPSAHSEPAVNRSPRTSCSLFWKSVVLQGTESVNESVNAELHCAEGSGLGCVPHRVRRRSRSSARPPLTREGTAEKVPQRHELRNLVTQARHPCSCCCLTGKRALCDGVGARMVR